MTMTNYETQQQEFENNIASVISEEDRKSVV